MNNKIRKELEKLLASSKEGNFDVVLDSEGLPQDEAEFINTANEITENYKAAMEYNMMKYRLTSDALGIALWDMDVVPDDPGNRDSRLIWSVEARRLLGFDSEKDFPNKLSSLTDRIHPQDRDRAINAFATHITDRTGKSLFDVEYRIMCKNGEYRYFHAFGTTLRDSDGTPIRVAGAIEDIDDKIKLQQSLKKTEEERIALLNLGNIMNGLNTRICVIDPQTFEVLFANESMQTTFNIQDGGIGQKCYKVIRGFDKKCDYCPCDELNKNPDAEVIWEQHNDLTNRIYRTYSRYINWPGGKTVHIQNAIDITDIKQTQEELENRNLRLNLLLGGLNIGFWDRTLEPGMAYDDDNAKIWWSDEFRKLLGYDTEEEFPNKIEPWLDSVHPDDLQMTIDAMNSFLSDKTGKTPYDLENRMKTKSGQYRWFRSFGSAIRDEDGSPIRTAGATEDITKRKETEVEIAEKTELYQTLFTNAPVGVTLFDENFKYVDCNENILRMFGGITREYYKEFFGSKDHSPQYQPDGKNSRDKAMNIIKQVVIDGETIKTDWVHQMPDGQPFPVEITMMRIKQDDRYLGLAYVYDMREQTRLKEDLQSALRKAEDANKAKSDFLAKMSHEIRTPMNAILGLTEIQMSSGKLSGETEEALGQIYDSGNMLMGIINDILDLSKIEADKLEIIPVTYDIMSLVNDTAQLNRMRSSSELIEFDIALDKDTPHNLIGDELRIKQILNNVLSNAFKYTDKGKIEFAIFAEKLDKKAKKALGSNAPADCDTMLIFRVSDTGQGMSKEQLELLFTDYTRFNLETNRTTSGTGLGLSITRRLADLMGGEVIVDSDVGKGSVFTIRIPQKRCGTQVCGAELADKLRDVRYHSSSFAKKTQFVREYMPYGRVLVVDDVESNIYVSKGMLLPYGLHVEDAASGIEAIEKVKAGNVYDIIFMDHMMPVMDGIEATGELRKMGYKGSIVALTANALIGQSDVFLKRGFDAFISKPIDSRELNHVLNDLIRNKKPREVVEAARREQAERQDRTMGIRKSGKYTDAMSQLLSDDIRASQMKKVIIRDAKRAVDTLERVFPVISMPDAQLAVNPDPPGSSFDNELELYIITVHGMKSSLANIGQADLSAVSQRLELAGKERDLEIIKSETPGFIASLKALTKDLEQPETSEDVSDDKKIPCNEGDMAFLREQLQNIKTACLSYNVTAARTALSSLSEFTWSKDVSDVLDKINIQLLHSDFEEAANSAESFIR